MMEEWTDIIGEQLESIREPLPEEDWKVLQQKYAASRQKKRHAAFAWAAGIASAAAAVVLALLLLSPGESSLPDSLVAESIPHNEVASADDGLKNVATGDLAPAGEGLKNVATEKLTSAGDGSGKVASVGEDSEKAASGEITSAGDGSGKAAATGTGGQNKEGSAEKTVGEEDSPAPTPVEVQIDTTTLKKNLIAYTTNFDGEGEELLPEEPNKRRNPISIGITGSVSSKFGFFAYAAAPDTYVPPINNIPVDTLTQEKLVYTKVGNSSEYYERYNHEMPVSFGVSARYFLSRRFAVNTGLTYTRYTSTRTRYMLLTGEKISTDKQYVHYLGIPLRLDLMLVNRTHFNLYLGGGINVDKCIYATVAGERLREKSIILGTVFTAGLQVNIVPSVGLYFEPQLSNILNSGTLRTARDELMISAQGGLRFNF